MAAELRAHGIPYIVAEKDRARVEQLRAEGVPAVYGDAAEPVTLGPNDSFQLPPHAQFRYANLTDLPTRVLWIFT